MMTGFGDFSTAVRALKGGAVDIVQKPVDHEALLTRIREALVTEEKARLTRVESSTAIERLKELTPRERAVLDLVVAGKSSKEIASQLELGVRTVETHRAHVMGKMGANSSADLVRMVLLARMAS
jgi:two-component system, LuxR family, response regulator FixJ